MGLSKLCQDPTRRKGFSDPIVFDIVAAVLGIHIRCIRWDIDSGGAVEESVRLHSALSLA